VPVLYAGETEEVAISESVLHDLPSRAARLVASAYVDRLTGAVAPRRNLRFAQVHSGGLIRLGITPDQLTDTGPQHSERTCAWAEAIHAETDVDGLVWMSRRWNSQRAVMLFRDRVKGVELEGVPGMGRDFLLPEDFEWLARLCHELDIAVIPPW